MTSYSPMANNRRADCLAAVSKKIERVERNVRRLEELNETVNEMLGVDWTEFRRHERNFLRILRARRERVKEELVKYNETHPTKDRKGDSQREVMALLRECPGFVTKLIEAKRPEKGDEKIRSCDCAWWNVTRGCSWDDFTAVKTEAEARKYYLKAYWLTACLNNLEMLTEGLGNDCPRVFSETLTDGKDLLWLIMSGKDVDEEDEGDASYEILQRVKATADKTEQKDEARSPNENNK